ncbi:hypothetical protein CB1_067854002 [Camelus ferus]|nr:hypothetical protein CB1_067854002 [Camelus ferus]
MAHSCPRRPQKLQVALAVGKMKVLQEQLEGYYNNPKQVHETRFSAEGGVERGQRGCLANLFGDPGGPSASEELDLEVGQSLAFLASAAPAPLALGPLALWLLKLLSTQS